MDLETFERHFAKTLADRRLSRGERKALKALIDELDPSPEIRRALVGRAFEAARDAPAGPRRDQVLTWLEDVMKLLLPTADARVGEAHFAPRQDCALRLRKLFDAERNRENLAVTDDRRLVAAFSDEFERLWTEFAPPPG